jgi:hypothetical protein
MSIFRSEGYPCLFPPRPMHARFGHYCQSVMGALGRPGSSWLREVAANPPHGGKPGPFLPILVARMYGAR